MGSNRRNSLEKRCLRCRINKNLCFCEFLTPLDIKTPIQVISHISEKSLTSNTSNLMSNIHPTCHIHYRGEKDYRLDYSSLLKEETHTPLFLFPHEDSVEIGPEFIRSIKKPINLVVPDGSWRQARKFYKRIPELAEVKLIRLPQGLKSKYTLRRAPQEGLLSTFEAMAFALGVIEGNELKLKLDEIFSLMVERFSQSRLGIRGTI